MADKPTLSSLFSQVDVTTSSHSHSSVSSGEEQTEVLRDVLSAQDRTNELLEELVGALTAQNKQRAAELNRWKLSNPELAQGCREAAETLSEVQAEFLERLTEEVQDSREELTYGDFLLTEFVDRYGPRLAHLNGVIQVLAQLGSVAPAPAEADEEF